MKKIFLVISAFIMLKLILPVHELWWDEAVYIGMGKYIYSFGTVGIWEFFRPIGLPMILGLLWKIGDVILLSKILALLLSVAYIYLTYHTTKRIFDEKTALFASILVILTPIFFYFSSHALTEIPSCLFALVAVNFYLDKRYLMAGIFAGISFMFRFPQGILLIGILLALKEMKKKVHVLAGFGLVVLPYLIFNQLMYGNMFSPILSASAHQSNEFYSVLDGTFLSFIYNLGYYMINLCLQNPIYLFFLPAIKKNRLLSSISILFLIYFTLITNKQVRFMLSFLPFIAIISASYIRKYPALMLLGLVSIYPIYMQNISISMTPKIYAYIPSEITVLASTPLPVAYIDSLFIPFYDNVKDASVTYESNKDINYVFYASEFYPCKDKSCNDARDALFLRVLENRSVIYHEKTYEDLYLLKKIG
jgi:4-amino-4-deoxy-L-arabinose transferase-like glycosyltransferase